LDEDENLISELSDSLNTYNESLSTLWESNLEALEK
jgi:hypothetical protein